MVKREFNKWRNFIGIEKDDKYFDISVNRINAYIKDNNLENIMQFNIKNVKNY